MNRRNFFQFAAGALALLAIPVTALANRIYTVEAGDSFYIRTPLDPAESGEVTVFDKHGKVKFGPVAHGPGSLPLIGNGPVDIKLPPNGVIESRPWRIRIPT